MTLSIVTLSYNTPDLVINCVSTLSNQFEKELKEGIVEIIVVDNASRKEVLETVEKELNGKEGIKLIKNKENLGFGGGCNLGAKNSKGEYILFLNSDTRTSDKGFLSMTEYLRNNSKVAILGGKLLNFDGTPQSSMGKFYNLFNFFIMLVGGERIGLLRSSPSKTCAVDWVSGACFMVRKSIFQDLGGFDEKLFMYMEDVELCFRAKKAGYEVYYYPDVHVSHKEQGSSNRTFAVLNIYKGLLYFYKKHKSKAEYQIVRFSLWIKALVVYLLGRLTNNNYYISTYGEALKLFR